MSDLKSCNIYEDQEMVKASGETLRPGGYLLTDKAIKFCRLNSKHSLLDVGCGRGATIAYLRENYNLNVDGVEPSKHLLEIGIKNNPNSKIVEGRGEELPFEDTSFNGVFTECTLSLMENKSLAIKEINRVLKREGYLVITDVYSRNTNEICKLKEFSINSCIRGLIDVEDLKSELCREGFEIILWEDHTQLLKQFMVNIVFTYGSMDKFWTKASSCNFDCEKFKKTLWACKPGYFLIIAKKNGR